ncbi:protein of unknown function (plasmid) [Rhodovastum atsumiense]|nr:protein of unknown function [Rhodovastum atsumiense]
MLEGRHKAGRGAGTALRELEFLADAHGIRIFVKSWARGRSACGSLGSTVASLALVLLSRTSVNDNANPFFSMIYVSTGS